MRVAFFSPLPPLATGIADYSATVLELLSDRHTIDAFHSQEFVDRGRLPSGCTVLPASTFAERQRKSPYDLTVYQMGNGPAHAFLYDHLSRAPGLLVLHDLVLHHSRAAHFLESEAVLAWRREPGSTAAREAARPWLERWRQELVYTYPDRGRRLFEAQVGTVGDLLPYAYPLVRIPVEASRMVAVHSTFMARALEGEVPGARVVRAPHPASREPVDQDAVRALRSALGFTSDHVVVGVFGLLTPEKRLETVARAAARAAAWTPGLRLLLAGPVPDRDLLERLMERLGMASRTVITGRVPLDQLAVHIEAADVVVHLRYPTARETSGALLRVLAQGRPTVISDLEHQEEIPDDAVVRADVAREEGDVTRALIRLATRPEIRAQLGRNAAAWVRREYSRAATRAVWNDVLERAHRQPDPPPRDWPSHWPRPIAPDR